MDACPRPTASPSPATALLILLATWSVLLAGGALPQELAPGGTPLLSFAGATVLLLATRPHPRRGAPPRVLLLALLAGYQGHPACLALVACVGLALGLPPAPLAGGAASAGTWLAVGVLAPLFEELLYRERLLPALRAHLGGPGAVVLSSAAFALPHVAPWPVLGSFVVGLGLGMLMLRAGSVAPCVAVHAGLNASALLRSA